MLVEIKKLLIENQGYKTNISLKKMYINSDNIVSITDYNEANKFLLRENSHLEKESFSLLKVNKGGATEEIIAFGSAEQLFSTFQNKSGTNRLLND